MIEVARNPDPDIPEALRPYMNAHGLKPKNIEQMAKAAKLDSVEALIGSPFLTEHADRMKTIESRNGNILRGEALHHAALIQRRWEMEGRQATVERPREETRSDIAALVETGSGSGES